MQVVRGPSTYIYKSQAISTLLPGSLYIDGPMSTSRPKPPQARLGPELIFCAIPAKNSKL